MSQSPFALAAPALIGMGYSPIPIAPRCDRKPLFEGDRPPEGKTPGRFKPVRDGNRYWFGFKQWKAFCKQQAHPSAIADWSSWPDAGVGVCCGYGGLLAIDVDNPDLIEPIRAILPPILVEKFGRKGFTAFYRSEHSRKDAEWWKKKNYKNADKRGLLDFLAAGSQTVVPPSPHKDGGHYVWTTERTLLNTPLEALPLFTDEHREAMERVLRKHGWKDSERRVASSRSTVKRSVQSQSTVAGGGWYDNFKRAAIAAMSQWVPKLGLYDLKHEGVAGARCRASVLPVAGRPWRSANEILRSTIREISRIIPAPEIIM